jgi:hypothetical protein
MRTTFKALFHAITLAIAAHSGSALAHGSVDRSDAGQLQAMTRAANLIAYGTVQKIEYGLEKAETKDSREIPFTYVTFGIEKTFRGNRPPRSLVMRFIGGPDGRGGFLEVSGVPSFQKGDKDVLFIAGNGESGCPLVLCQAGRFRVLEGGLYNAHGVPVRALVKEGVIARGKTRKEFLTRRYPAPKFDELIKNPAVAKRIKSMGMSLDDARTKYNAEAPKEIVVTKQVVIQDRAADEEHRRNSGIQAGPAGPAIVATEEPLPENPIAIEEFFAAVTELSERVGGNVERVRSMSLRRIQPLGAPRPAKPIEAKAPESDDAERQMLRDAGGNPVLKN